MDRRKFTQLTATSLLCTPGVAKARLARRVLIVGAGAAGLTAAYHLNASGIDVRIIEASNRWGGRIKRLSGFSNVPLDLGAEWIHGDPSILGRILGQGRTALGIKTIDYRPQTYQFWHNGGLNDFSALRHTYKETKFFDTTWHGFFERFVLPKLSGAIDLNASVTSIRADGPGVDLRLSDGRAFEADKVLVTVPLSVLQRDLIHFSDELKPPHLSALQEIDFGGGFKAFLKFDKRFYPDILFEGPRLSILANAWAEKIYYDAAFGKPTSQNILGLFTVSDSILHRAKLDDQALLQDILAELEGIFGPVVTNTFVHGVVQNWSQEPYIMGSYSMSNNGRDDVADILAPIEGKVFFAGEALGGDAQSTVHGAAFSAIDAVKQIKAS